MTKEELKCRLKAAYDISLYIEQKQQEIAVCRSMAEKATTSYSASGSFDGGDGKAMENAVLRLVRLEDELGQSICRWAEAVEDINSLIASLPDWSQRRLLHKRYILHLKWERIASDMNYSYRGIHRLHNRALDDLLAYNK